MKTSTNVATGVSSGTTVSDYLKTADSVQVVPRLTLTWSLNRYVTPTADNTPSEDTDGFDIETFPITSLFGPNRPTKGINKAIVNQSTAARGYKNATDVKFYVGDQDDVYKYWTSPQPTNGSGTFPLHTDAATVARPRVEYPSVQQANKIVVKLETTWATPLAYKVNVKPTVAGAYNTYVTVATNPTISQLGVITLYYNGSAWVTTKPSTLVTTPVAGIELAVTTMTGGTDRAGNATTYVKVDRTSSLGSTTTITTNGANSNLNVIAIEAQLEVDFTSRLISEDSNLDMAETSDLYPIGQLTTNDGTLTLSNDDRLLDLENASSPYYHLLQQNVHVNLEYLFTISGVQHSIQQYKMYTGLWEPQGDGTVQVELQDHTKFFDSDKPRAFVWEGLPTSEIIWRICDSVGFIDYSIVLPDTVSDHSVPVFWSDGTKTVLELFSELAEATQTAIYIDGTGVLQVRTREAAFDETASANVHLLGHQSGANLANIISITDNEELHANKLTVSYRDTKWKVGTGGDPAVSEVWSPGDTMVVRSTQLTGNITGTPTAFFIDQKDAAVWPYTSKVQIDGEIIQYDGKEYDYITGTNTHNKVWVKSLDDIKKQDLKTPVALRYKNHLTGAMQITGRGVWNSDQRDHSVDANNWTTWQIVYTGGSGGAGPTPRGFKFNRTESTVTIDTPGNMKDTKDLFLAFQGNTAQTGYFMYGTRFKFESGGGSTQRAGIAFQITGSNNNGYYVEVRPSSKINGKDRKSYNEVMVWARTNTGYVKIAGGFPVALREPRWYDLDVYVNRGTQDTITVWLNGVEVATGTTTGATKQPDSAKLAMYARGKSKITYEYFYAIARNITEPADDFGFYDLKDGGFRGGQWQLEQVWQKSKGGRRPKKKSTKNKAKYNGYLFDEFGPYVHEVREFTVKFDPAPVQYSYLFSTNYWNASPVEYNADNFGANFVIANTSRSNAVLQGDDALTIISGSPINQVCDVLGRDLIVADDQTVTKQNDAGIRIDGEIEIELTSDWLQTVEMANDICTWMGQHWSLGVDQINLTVFGNPCYELGDIVDIDWPIEHMTTGTHVYFVVGVETSWDNGITTSLTLRRRNIAAESSLT